MNLLSTHEELVGTAGADVLIGTNPVDAFFFGGRGNDVLIYNGDGSATLNGGCGNDVLIGGDGSNFLSGGRGCDTIIGGPETDIFLGGRGHDHFFLKAESSTDFIEDFQHGIDKIHLRGLHFSDLLIDQSAGAIFDNRGTPENPHVIAILAPGVTLTAHDFLFA